MNHENFRMEVRKNQAKKELDHAEREMLIEIARKANRNKNDAEYRLEGKILQHDEVEDMIINKAL